MLPVRCLCLLRLDLCVCLFNPVGPFHAFFPVLIRASTKKGGLVNASVFVVGFFDGCSCLLKAPTTKPPVQTLKPRPESPKLSLNPNPPYVSLNIKSPVSLISIPFTPNTRPLLN